MKRLAFVLTLVLLLCGCVKTPPPATTAPPLPTETTAPHETTEPLQTTSPTLSDPFAEWYILLDYTYPQTNWLRNAMGCVFETPAEIDLEFLFYAGFRDGSWDKLSPESEASLIDQGFWREMDLQPMPVSEIEVVLNSTFGISLSDCTIPDGWRYAEKEDFYCSNHNDAFFPGVPTITAVEDDGHFITIHYTIDSYWLTATGEFLDTAPLVLSLVRNEDGTIHAVSNLLES